MSKTFGTSCVSDGCANERPRWMIMRAADGGFGRSGVCCQLKTNYIYGVTDTPHTSALRVLHFPIFVTAVGAPDYSDCYWLDVPCSNTARLWAPDNFLISGYHNSFSGVKQPGSEVGHSPPSSAEAKNDRSCTSTPPVCLHGVDRETFTFTSELLLPSDSLITT
jgi:hypothetical protein